MAQSSTATERRSLALTTPHPEDAEVLSAEWLLFYFLGGSTPPLKSQSLTASTLRLGARPVLTGRTWDTSQDKPGTLRRGEVPLSPPIEDEPEGQSYLEMCH